MVKLKPRTVMMLLHSHIRDTDKGWVIDSRMPYRSDARWSSLRGARAAQIRHARGATDDPGSGPDAYTRVRKDGVG